MPQAWQALGWWLPRISEEGADVAVTGSKITCSKLLQCSAYCKGMYLGNFAKCVFSFYKVYFYLCACMRMHTYIQLSVEARRMHWIPLEQELW